MEKAQLKQSGNKSSMINFGLHGWIVIVFCLLMFWFYAGMVNSGNNIAAPLLAEKYGVSTGTILNMNTVAGVLAIGFFIIIGQINKKIGASKTSGICTVIAGVAYIAMGQVSSVTSYTVLMTILAGTMMSAGYIGGGELVTQWFPKKKGIVMGYTTMGHNLATAVYVPFISYLAISRGITSATMVIGLMCAIVGVVIFIFSRDLPQLRGQNPDYVSDEVYQNEYSHDDSKESMWTVSKLLRTKEMWLVAITTGLFQVCTLGVVSQLVPRNIALGFSYETALSVGSLVAIIGLVGSWLVGLLDTKFGSKKAMAIFGIFYALALFANATEYMPLVYLSIFMLGMGIGGSANFTTSLTVSVFGRKEFSNVNAIVFPIQGAVSAFSFIINGTVLNITGGDLKYAYVALGVISIVTVIIVSFVDEYRFNEDIKVEAEV